MKKLAQTLDQSPKINYGNRDNIFFCLLFLQVFELFSQISAITSGLSMNVCISFLTERLQFPQSSEIVYHAFLRRKLYAHGAAISFLH